MYITKEFRNNLRVYESILKIILTCTLSRARFFFFLQQFVIMILSFIDLCFGLWFYGWYRFMLRGEGGGRLVGEEKIRKTKGRKQN